ncbi:DUF4136 domain-containing protein [Mongoliitalea lutea]|uniref:DUF4136 domain-containing protein n=1 Tax=Mongoliitalea lutea TaxID=849756 RepID=A0A8J3D2U1_9BACT|nr:DUF4136 domain-containing protein [Mongoliitalea lutea]GHB48486.1 hypothetical protein GCM10008106_31630 [Mongoliitalea lutea]
MKIYFWTMAVFIGLLFVSCLPSNRPDDISDLAVVYTNFNPEFQFNQGTTYALPPNVIILTSEGVTPGERPPTLDFVANQQLLNVMRNNMNARGFTLVNIQNQPDFILFPTVTTEGREILFDYDSQFWTWWFPELGPGIRFQYPNFSPLINNSFNTGTLLMQLVDNRNRTSNAPLPVHWVGVVNMGLSQSLSDNTTRAIQGINQAFNQTPAISR